MPLAQQLLRVSDAEFVRIDELDTESLDRKIRTMRSPKISGFVVLANTDTIARLTKAVTRLERLQQRTTVCFLCRSMGTTCSARLTHGSS